jgi:hypothetical protein
MSSSLWLSIEPRSTETRLLLSVAGSGPSLKAALPTRPAHPHALVRLMRQALPTPPKAPLPETPINPTTSDLAQKLALTDVLRSLGLEHAAASLDTALQKAIARNDSPSSVIDYLMRDQLRVHLEDRARTAVKRSCIFPVTTLDTYDFNDPPPSTATSSSAPPPSTSYASAATSCSSGPAGSAKPTSPTPWDTSRASRGIAFDSYSPPTSSTTSSAPRHATP